MNKTDRADIDKKCLPFPMAAAWLLSLAAVAGWAWVIWGFSAAPDLTSSSMSRLVCEKLADLWIFLARPEMTPQARFALIESLQFPVRKAAHFTEYAILGSLLVFHVRAALKMAEPEKPVFDGRPVFTIIRRRPFIGGMAAGILYAVIDEIHQIFVPGRACRAADVCIDSAGLLAGTLLTLVFISIYLNMKRRRKPDPKLSQDVKEC